jgi:serine/threonine protein kinase
VVGSQESVYLKKIIKYKEISHYIKGEMLGKGSFGKVKEFIDKNSLKQFLGKIFNKELNDKRNQM